MRTPVEEMLHFIENNDIDNILEYRDTMRIVCKDLLKKEKNYIINAYRQGKQDLYDAMSDYELNYSGLDYYNEKFKDTSLK